ncbi:MAG TPA: undecaprenyl-diphosphate phosphatase [Bacillota bacterium]|nr:undecaprenyl-diphosphate phosphatase [Bacillota bacterium]
MTLGALLFLALLQGLTEFLPVSSSGHLVLGQHWLNVSSPGVYLEVALHLGTLVSVLIVFRRDVLLLLKAVLDMVVTPFTRKKVGPDPYRRLAFLLIIGSIPAALAGIFLGDVFASLFADPRVVGVSLLATGVLLLYSGRTPGPRDLSRINLKDALMIGLGQALAITPGLSRSGTTIAAALFRGLSRDAAVRFSFLLSLPVILGAGLLELPAALQGEMHYPAWWLLIGALVSAASGIVAILWLIKLLKQGRLRFLAYYVFALGSITLLFVR